MERKVRAEGRLIEYELRATDRKSMEIRVFPDGVRVFVPRRARLRDVDDFVRGKAAWIIKAQSALEAHGKRREQEQPMCDGASVLYEGNPLPLRVVRGDEEGVALLPGALRVTASDESPDAVRALLRGFLFDRAQDKISERIKRFAPLAGRMPERVTIRDQRTRWGSCSNRNNLNFNYKLIMAPPEALDYVVIHELCHLHEFNHSERFWKRVADLQADFSIWKKWLRDNGRMLGV